MIICQAKEKINIGMKIRLGMKYIADIEITRWYMSEGIGEAVGGV